MLPGGGIEGEGECGQQARLAALQAGHNALQHAQPQAGPVYHLCAGGSEYLACRGAAPLNGN